MFRTHPAAIVTISAEKFRGQMQDGSLLAAEIAIPMEPASLKALFSDEWK
jgi:hypothetical protein